MPYCIKIVEVAVEVARGEIRKEAIADLLKIFFVL
jgi:hypothetical protein